MRNEAVLRYAEYKKRSNAFLLIVFAPIFSLVMALRNYQLPWAKNMVWLFTIFYGYTFVFSSQGLDSDRYVKNLELLASQHSVNFSDFTKLLYSEETSYVDILQPFLTFIISRFTNDGRILFACFAVIFGYFYSRNVWFLLDRVEGKIKKQALPFIILFVFIIAIWQINGFRFYTAAHIFIYGLFNRIGRSYLKGTLICALSIFVHFSFVFPVIVLLVYSLVGNRSLLFLAFYVASFSVTQISPGALTNFSDLLPEVFQERTDRYTSEAYIKGRAKSFKERPGNWYVKGRFVALNYCLNVLFIFIFWKRRDSFKSRKDSLSLLCFGLLLASLLNLLVNLPSMERFYQIFYMIGTASIFIFCQTYSKKLFPLWLNVTIVLVMILYVLVEIRVGFQTVGPLTIIGNPLIAPFISNDVTINDIIDGWIR